MTATDLVAWSKLIGFADQPALARCEIETFRYRVLHVAARISRGARQTWLRIDASWPWAQAIAAAGTASAPRSADPPPLTVPDRKNPPGQRNRRPPDTTVGPSTDAKPQNPCSAAPLNRHGAPHLFPCKIEASDDTGWGVDAHVIPPLRGPGIVRFGPRTAGSPLATGWMPDPVILQGDFTVPIGMICRSHLLPAGFDICLAHC